MIEEVHTNVAKHLIEVGELDKDLDETKRELVKLEEQQKFPEPSQEFIDILEGFLQLDEFMGIKPKDGSPKNLGRAHSIKKSSKILVDTKDKRMASDRAISSSVSDRELDDDNVNDLFMIENSFRWQRNNDGAGKRLYISYNLAQ